MRSKTMMACAVIAPLLMAAAQPVRLQPSSKWVVDYAENSCHLIRTFGEGDSTTLLAFESDAPGDMDMLLVGKPLRTSEEEVPVRFLPLQSEATNGMVLTSTTGKPAVLLSHVPLLPEAEEARLKAEEAWRKANPGVRPPAADPAQQLHRRSERQAYAANTVELQIDGRRGRPVILETGSLGTPIRMFDQCSRDSLEDWGVDPEVADKIVKPVWAGEAPARWFDPADYPKTMLFAGQQSNVKARVLVDAAGRVTKCTSLSHFELPEFNKLVCDKITKRAKFEPAELADGTKVPSYYTVRVNFRIAR